MTDILDLIRNNATKAIQLRRSGRVREAQLYEARVSTLIERATARGDGEAAQAVEQSVYDEALGDEEDSGLNKPEGCAINPVLCNPPISPADAAAIEHVLEEHGYHQNPGARPGENEIETIKLTKKRKNPKQANAWKKRFKSRKAMERYMRKLRKLADEKQAAIERRMAKLRAKARIARMRSR